MDKKILNGSLALLQTLFLFPGISALPMTGSTITGSAIDGMDSVMSSSGYLLLILIAIIVGIVLLRKYTRKK